MLTTTKVSARGVIIPYDKILDVYNHRCPTLNQLCKRSLKDHDISGLVDLGIGMHYLEFGQDTRRVIIKAFVSIGGD